MAEKNMDAKISVDFEESSSRQQLNSGEDITTLFGKIRKFFSDLKAVAFSGAYSDLSGAPESLPASGGNADTVDDVHISCTNDATPNSNWFAAFSDNNNLRAIDPGRAYVGNAGNAITANSVKSMSVIGTASDVTHNSVLEWANSVVGLGTACVVQAYGYPSDLPLQQEGMLTVETCYQKSRKIVTFTSYADIGLVYQRSIYNSRWRSEWYQTKAGNADTVNGHSVGCDVPENAKFTDTVPDLSAYAKTADVPSIKVNSARNADYAGSLKPTLIGTGENCTYHTILEWANSVNGMGQAHTLVSAGYPSDTPVGDEGMITVETDVVNNRKVVTFKSYGSGRGTYRRNIWNGEWRWDWVDLFSEKLYVTGEGNCGDVVSATAMNLQIFDFTPSAVICQIANGSAFFAEPIQNGFRVLLVPTDNGKILKYIAFK